MGIIEKYEKRFEYAGILMNLFLAFQFFILWYSPELDQAGKIYTSLWLIVFEFFMVHSSVILAVLPKRVSFIFLFVFYGTFAWIFNKMVPGNLILYIYLILVFNRMRYAFYEVDPLVKKRTVWSSRLAFVSYLILMVIIALGNQYVSRLGLTEEFLITSGYTQLASATGLFVEQPHLALCLGCIYYTVLSVEAFLLTRYWQVDNEQQTEMN